MPPSSGEAGPVPENLPGLSDPQLFREFERGAAAVRIAELDLDPTLAAEGFDFAHLQRIHHYILKDVYRWAGDQELLQQMHHSSFPQAERGMSRCVNEAV